MSQCSDYNTRFVRFGYGWTNATLPLSSCTLSFNYLKSFSPSIKENVDVAPIISGTRDQARFSILGEEVDIDSDFELLSPYPLFFALGSISASAPYTIGVGSSLPVMTFVRYLTPVESGEKNLLTIWGARVDKMEVSIESNGIASASASYLCSGSTISSTVTTFQGADYSYDPITSSDVNVRIDGVVFPDIGRISFTVNNSLKRAYTVSNLVGYRAYCVREGALEIEGRVEVGAYALTMLDKVLGRASGHTIELVINKTHGGVVNSTITFPNVVFTEYPEKLENIEPYSVEIPFRCVPSSNVSAISIVTNTLVL